MTTWKRGRQLGRGDRCARTRCPWTSSSATSRRRQPPRVPGTAVFMTSDPTGVPVVLLHHLKHNKVLHEKVVHHVDRGRGDPAGATPRSGWRCEALGDGLLPGHRPLRLHGDARRARRCSRSVESRGAPSPAHRDQLLSRPRDRSLAATGARPQPGAAGASSCSSSWRGTRSPPPRSSTCRPTGCSSWARRSSSDPAPRLEPRLLPYPLLCSRISRSATQAVALEVLGPYL